MAAGEYGCARHRPHALPAAARARRASASRRPASPTASRSASRTTARSRDSSRRSPRSRCSRRSATRSTANFFAACDRLLAPGGLACDPDDRRCPTSASSATGARRTGSSSYIFPGSLLPSLEALQTAMSRASGLMVVGLEEIGTALRGHAEGVARAVLREPPRGARARLRRPLHPDLGLLPRLLRGAVQDPGDPRHTNRPRPAIRGARVRIRTCCLRR